MKLRLIFGVILPAIIILILTVLSSLDVGFSVYKNYDKKLTLDDIFANSTLRNQIEIGKIVLTNDYFLPKRYDLPNTFACLIDSDNIKQNQNAGYLFYSEGDSSVPTNSYFDSYYYYGYQYGSKSVEVGANKEKTVIVYLHPEGLSVYDYYSNKTQQQLLIENYGDYDYVAFVERESNYYNDCYSLSQSELSSARKISLK